MPKKKDLPMVVVALPQESDPVHKIGAEEKHSTILYLGPDVSQEHFESACDAVSTMALDLAPFTVPVKGYGPLGDEDAQVWFLSEDSGTTMLSDIRDILLHEFPILAQLYNSTEQYPLFTPHVTIEYGEDLPDKVDSVKAIRFDRLAVWHGPKKQEFNFRPPRADWIIFE